MSKVLFAPMAFSRYEASETLPEKFSRLLEHTGLAEKVKGKKVAIKMHVGSGTSYSTIPPIFVRKLVRFIQKNGGDCFITDHYVHGRKPDERGYTEANLGCPVLDDCGFLGKYYYTKEVDYKTFKHVDVAGLIHDADFMIDFSHVKGHGACGFGGACKNIAMGCVTDRTRHEQHSLEGGLSWDADKCIHCDACIRSCNHHANKFNDKGEYEIFFHHCTACQLCVSACPNGVLRPATELDRFMQPELSYERGYCRPECTRCSEVCPVGAIKPITKEEKASMQVGHAVWIRKNCVVITDDVHCGNCERHCPTGAIQMVPSDENNPRSHKIPVINTERCIGCGACENLCPARPYSAIYVEGHLATKII